MFIPYLGQRDPLIGPSQPQIYPFWQTFFVSFEIITGRPIKLMRCESVLLKGDSYIIAKN